MINKHLSNEITYFYKSLTVEKRDFNLPFPELLQSGLLVIERRNGKIVGIAGISRGNSFFLVVKSEYQNQKIGQKLTRKVIEYAKKKSYHCITLNVFQSNSRAIHIYRKFGFAIIFADFMESRKNLFMILPLDFKGSFCKIYIMMARKLRLILKGIPHAYTLCMHVRRLVNGMKDKFLRMI